MAEQDIVDRAEQLIRTGPHNSWIIEALVKEVKALRLSQSQKALEAAAKFVERVAADWEKAGDRDYALAARTLAANILALKV